MEKPDAFLRRHLAVDASDTCRARPLSQRSQAWRQAAEGYFQRGKVYSQERADGMVALDEALNSLAALVKYPLEALAVQPHGLSLNKISTRHAANGGAKGKGVDEDKAESFSSGNLRLFVRQSFTECGPEEKQVVQSVLDILRYMEGHPFELEILTGNSAKSRESFRRAFEKESGLEFTPKNFRSHRFQQLDRADAMIVVRTGLSESSAVEIVYNLFNGRRIPIFFAVWRKAPIKTTMLRELDDLATVRYVEFDHPDELKRPLLDFFKLIAPMPDSLLAGAAADSATERDDESKLDEMLSSLLSRSPAAWR